VQGQGCDEAVQGVLRVAGRRFASDRYDHCWASPRTPALAGGCARRAPLRAARWCSGRAAGGVGLSLLAFRAMEFQESRCFVAEVHGVMHERLGI